MLQRQANSKNDVEGSGGLAGFVNIAIIIAAIMLLVTLGIQLVQTFGNIDANTPILRWVEAVENDCQGSYTVGDFSYDSTNDNQLKQCEQLRIFGGPDENNDGIPDLENARMGQAALEIFKWGLLAGGVFFGALTGVGTLNNNKTKTTS